ncbi:MAG: S8 family peptidase [Bdellovibrionaceae bacterium]|nr:S8 family peptidase [Pseudobdellovibrionaceae bacterium]
MKCQVSILNYFLAGMIILFEVACSQPGSQSGFDLERKKEGPQSVDKYIVVFKKDSILSAQSSLTALAGVQATMSKLEDQYQLQSASLVFSEALQGGVYEMTEDQARALATHTNIAYVEKDQIVTINTNRAESQLGEQLVRQLVNQSGVTWGLDRIDQASLPLNQTYSFESEAGRGVNAYVIDTGIMMTHEEFQGRAVSGFDLVDNDRDATDCNGHGTHVAGTIGSLHYGVAKNVNLVGVRVLDCGGSGTNSGVIAGVEWVTKNHVSPAVANMSLGGPISKALEDAIAASIQSGVTYVVAAGNENRSACLGSPARLSSAIKVGSSTSRDERSSFSNFGECVDIFAPGSDITSTWWTSNTTTHTISGTSMAAPHGAGVVALYLSRSPTAMPAEVKAALLKGSAVGKVVSAGTGSPNRLLNTQFLSGVPPIGNESQLKNGVRTSLISLDRGEEKYFSFSVPTNKRSLTIEISGGTGDADLFVKFGEKATLAKYDCRPYRGGNSEKCVFNSPTAGVYYIMLNGYSSSSGLVLKGTYK